MRLSRRSVLLETLLPLAVLGLGLAIVLSLRSSSTPNAPVARVHFKLASHASAAFYTGPIGAKPLFARPARELRRDAEVAISQTREDIPDLTLWYWIEVEATAAQKLARELEANDSIKTAFVAPVPELPSGRADLGAPGDGDSCPIKTPSYEPHQGYLSPAPAGINAPAAWARPGGLGQNVRFADIEGGWNHGHEDLPGERVEHVAGRKMSDRNWVAHGTAVLGEVAARDNGIGMVGIAPDIDKIFTASIGGLSAAAAIDAAAMALRPGDVLLIELHSKGPRGRFLPMEFWDDVYEVIKVATSRGVIVIEAAGNGSENLDHRAYKGKLDRRKRDSGAIMVGAGAPARDGWVDRSRLDFSNYGSRVDVQGWGRHVATLDYGDLQSCAERRERDYTDLFGGTSSASPIVAGAAILVQSVSVAERQRTLQPQEMRDLLIRTGSPQTDGPHGSTKQHIGPRPDLARALDWR